GFAGKWLLFWSALGVHNVASGAVDQERLFRVLALIAAINAAIGAWYYLRIAAVMYLREPARRLSASGSRPALAAVAACAIVTFVFGIYPDLLEQRTHDVATPPK